MFLWRTAIPLLSFFMRTLNLTVLIVFLHMFIFTGLHIKSPLIKIFKVFSVLWANVLDIKYVTNRIK